jgi:hypothetical protein
MQGPFRRRLLACAFLAATIQGCSTIPTQRHIELQRVDETLLSGRAGRFVAQAVESPTPDNPRGAQGRFEWRESRSGPTTRRLLLVIGPFGQSLGGVEETLMDPPEGSTIAVFDEQGRVVGPKDQVQMLSSLLGHRIEDPSPQTALLRQLMQSLSAAAQSGKPVHDTDIAVSGVTLRLRIAFDAQ